GIVGCTGSLEKDTTNSQAASSRERDWDGNFFPLARTPAALASFYAYKRVTKEIYFYSNYPLCTDMRGRVSGLPQQNSRRTEKLRTDTSKACLKGTRFRASNLLDGMRIFGEMSIHHAQSDLGN